MATKLQCLACGQMYQLGRDNPPWPKCRACQGELAPLLEALEVVEEPAPLADDSALLGLSDVDPLATAPSPFAKLPLGAGRPSSLGLIIGVTGGGIALLLMILIGVIWSISRRPVARTPIPVVQLPTPFQTNTNPTVRPQKTSPNSATSGFSSPSSPNPRPPQPAETASNHSTDRSHFGTINSIGDRDQQGFVQRAAFQPRTPWKVTPDPATELEIVESAPPDSTTSPKLIDIDFKSRVDRLVFPDRPSNFFAAANDDPAHPEIRVFDWRTGKSLGRKFPGRLSKESGTATLSADGEHMATLVDYEDGQKIVVVDTKTGKAVHAIDVDSHSSVIKLAFAGPNQFLAMASSYNADEIESLPEAPASKFAPKKSELMRRNEAFARAKAKGIDRICRVGVWNLEDGSVVKDFRIDSSRGVDPKQSVPNSGVNNDLAISPGGRYLAILVNNIACFHEIETGELVGEILMPPLAPNMSATLSFSPDGKELVSITNDALESCTLHRVDIAKGEMINSAKVNIADFNDIVYYQSLGRIQFLSQIKCLLLDGAFIVEPNTGETLYRIDAFQGMAKVIDGQRVAGITAREKSVGFAEIRLPVAELETLATVFQGGGKLLDGLWGEARVTTIDEARSLRIPSHMTEWTLPAWEAPKKVAGKKIVSLPMPLTETSTTRSTPTLSQALKLQRSSSPSYSNQSWKFDAPIFSPSASKIAWLPRHEQKSGHLYVVDVASGRAEGDIEMLPNTRALDLSPDGSLVIVGFAKRDSGWNSNDTCYERLEVFSIPQKRHVFAWKLGGVMETVMVNGKPQSGGMFKSAHFIEKTLVLTKMASGNLVLWKLPEATALWQIPGDIDVVDFSPDRSYVQLNLKGQEKFSWLDVRTGEWKGDMRSGGGRVGATLAISPDGKRTASMVNGAGYTKLSFGDVSQPDDDGRHFMLPQLSGPVTWLNDRFLLAMGSGIIIDASNGAPVWQMKSTLAMSRTAEGTFWLSERKSVETNYHRTAFPSDRLLTKLKAARSMPLAPLVGPGSRVSVQGGFDSDADSQARIQKELDRRGWILDPNATLRISGSVSQLPGRTQEYRNMLNGQRSSVNVPGATVVQMSVTDANGNVLWNSESHTGGGYAPSMVMLRDGESLQDHVSGRPGSGPRPEMSHLPEIIFAKKPFDNLPGTLLSEKGEQY